MPDLGSNVKLDRRDLVSLSERMSYLQAMRAAFIVAVLAVTRFDPKAGGAPLDLIAPSALYGLLILSLPLVRRLERERALPILAGVWLLDGLYVAWVLQEVGGLGSPLAILVFVHVIAITLLGSYRTGLKIAAWYSLLYVVAAYAQGAGIIEWSTTATDRDGLLTDAIRGLGALWAVTLVTAAFSTVNERELRRSIGHLERLSAMAAAFDEREAPADIPRILLETATDVFGVKRGLVLASEEGDLELVASTEHEQLPPVPSGLDPVMERAWARGRSVLVKALDPQADPRLGALLPAARNLLVVPMYLDGGYRLGLLILEHPARHGYIRRSELVFIEQFASRAGVALHNAWLLERVQQQLDENQVLQRKLAAHNASLESAVEERTAELSETIDQLRASDTQRRRLLSRLVSAEEDERRRIAGDIHDDPVQKIVALDMHIQLLRRRVSDPELAATLEKLLGIARSAIGSLRQMLFELRPAVLDEDGIAAALREHVEGLERDFDIELTDDLSREPSQDARVVLYRIAQEALANVRKHAAATRVHIVLDEQRDGFALQIADDGVGFSPPSRIQPQGGHLGLTYMRERAEMAGGTCEVHSLPGGGTAVEVWLPAEALPTATANGNGSHPARSAEVVSEVDVTAGSRPV